MGTYRIKGTFLKVVVGKILTLMDACVEEEYIRNARTVPSITNID